MYTNSIASRLAEKPACSVLAMCMTPTQPVQQSNLFRLGTLEVGVDKNAAITTAYLCNRASLVVLDVVAVGLILGVLKVPPGRRICWA